MSGTNRILWSKKFDCRLRIVVSLLLFSNVLFQPRCRIQCGWCVIIACVMNDWHWKDATKHAQWDAHWQLECSRVTETSHPRTIKEKKQSNWKKEELWSCSNLELLSPPDPVCIWLATKEMPYVTSNSVFITKC